MNITRCILPIRARNPSRELIRKFSTSSRRYEASSHSTQPQIKEEKFEFEDLNVLERVERRKPQIAPFMKDAFVSVYNRELLAYPEILNREESESLDHRVKTVSSVLENPETTKSVKESAIKQSKLLVAPISWTQGGLDMLVTERIRYLETLSSDVQLSRRLSDHWVGLDALKLGLPPDELEKFIPDVISGACNIALCTKEKISTRVAQPDFRSTAQLDHDNVWRLTGEKLCREDSAYLLTLCTVETTRLKGFLIHPKAEGVIKKPPFVALRDTPATVLSEISEAQLSKVLALSRLDTAVMSYSLLKRMILKVTEYVRGKFVSGKPLAELPQIRAKVSEALLTLYTAESMAYFTAGLLDGYENPDADLEIAMCRTFTSEHGLDSVMSLLTIPGLEGLDEDWVYFLDEFRNLALKDELNDTLNTYIALNGLHHAGLTMAAEIKQMRNPLYYPSFIIKKMFSNRHQVADEPKLTLHLEEHLHQSLQQSAQYLEYGVLRLRYACEVLLSRHGADVIQAPIELERLAKAATEVFAMTSVLARASRAYCIGLRNAETEMRLAATYAEISKKRLKDLIMDIDNGEYLNLDHFRLDFGKKVLDTGGVLVEKPTERVWW